MTAPRARVGRLASISLDCADPGELAEFYAALLGLDRLYTAPDGSVISLSDNGTAVVALTVMRVAHYQPPTWPEDERPKQMHIDVSVVELVDSVAAAVALGASLVEHQPQPGLFRVLLDPAGHPFCLTTAGI